MHEHLEEARDAVDEAKQITDNANAQQQLASIREGLETLDDSARDDPDGNPLEDPQVGDRLESVERQLTQLGEDVESLTRSHLQTARDHIDAYRREYAPDWEPETGEPRDAGSGVGGDSADEF